MIRILLCAMLMASSFLTMAQEPTTVFLTRHAEKQAGEDPGLTEEGTQRAHDLATLLSTANLSAVMSTDTRRTRDTGQPTAEAAGVELTLVDQGGGAAIVALADRIREMEGSVLVVGHSNTIPVLVAVLGGPKSEIAYEDYADFFVVTLLDGEHVSTVRLTLP